MSHFFSLLWSLNLNFLSFFVSFLFFSLSPILSLNIIFFSLVHSAEQRVMLLFSVINVCLANTLIISTRANRIDNYTLYTEALSHCRFLSFIPSHCFFHLASSLLSFSVVLDPIVCGICFWEHCGVFPLVIDINEVLLDCVRSGNVCLWRRTKKYYTVAAECFFLLLLYRTFWKITGSISRWENAKTVQSPQSQHSFYMFEVGCNSNNSTQYVAMELLTPNTDA